MRCSLEDLGWRGQFTVLLWDYMVKCFGENSWLVLWIWKHLIYVNFVVLGKINSWMSWFHEATESGIFGICSSKCVFLVPSWWQLWPIPWPDDCNLVFLYSNSVTYDPDFLFFIIIFFCSIWWWGFSGKRQQHVHLCICEHTTLPVGDSLDQQLLFAGCWSPCANTRSYAAHPGFNKNCAPNYKVVMVFAWLLHQNFMECPPLRWPQFPSVLSVFTTFPHFISSFCHSSCPRLVHACVIWVLQPTKRRLKWFSLKGMEVRPRPTVWKRLWLLLLCPNCWAGSSLPLVTTW